MNLTLPRPREEYNVQDQSSVRLALEKVMRFLWESTSSLTGRVDTVIKRRGGGLKDGVIDEADLFATTIQPVRVVSVLPLTADEGNVCFLTTDGQLYRWHLGAWTLVVQAVNISGEIVAAQIAAAAITTAKFAAGIRPVRILGALPGSGDLVGDIVLLTTDNKLYRWTGAAWTAAVPTVDLTGTIATAQIAVGAITTALVAAAAITTTEIADNAISTPKLTAGAVTAAKITAGTITTTEIAAGTIVAANIAAATITGAKIAANTITASNIAADTITAGEIAAGAISTSELAAGAVTAAKIAALTITASEIAANTITGGKIAAATITATNIAAATITSNELAANSVIAGKIAAGAINAGSIIVNSTITAAHLVAGTITANEIAVSTITAAHLSITALSAITANIGTVTAGLLNSANGYSYIDLNATGASPFIHHADGSGNTMFELLADGTMSFGAATAPVDMYLSSNIGRVHLQSPLGVIFRDLSAGINTFIFDTPFAATTTGLSLLVNRTGAGVTMEQVSIGAANSAGAGRRLLSVAN
jgi:hypothetical protein